MLEGLRKLFTAEDWMPARRVLQRDAEWWNKLRNDCSVRFGFMPQNELSGKKLDIADNTLYQFGSGRFLSHQLMEDGKPLCQMIVANAGQNQVYLALSRPLGQRDIINLFADEERLALPALQGVNKLYVREHTPGIKDWVTMQYLRRIDGMRGQKTTAEGTRTFQYLLFVNEANDKALEIEWFDDGGFEVYATIYRPLSDIVQVHHERRPNRSHALTSEAGNGPRLPEAVSQASTPTESGAEIIEWPAPRKNIDAVPPAAPEAIEEITEEGMQSKALPHDVWDELPEVPASQMDEEDFQEALPSMQEISEDALPPATAQSPGNLTCNIRVAAKIIDEAIRNDMHLGDIVRRVLGLPLSVAETVNFHVPLSADDYAVLGERYGVVAEDREMIHACIVQDLIDFTGERESEIRRRRAAQG
jgi:hypothetical protein